MLKTTYTTMSMITTYIRANNNHMLQSTGSWKPIAGCEISVRELCTAKSEDVVTP